MADESTEDDDYLFASTDKVVLKNLAQMGTHLKELKLKMLMAETEFNVAKKEYEYYANSVMPMEMYNAGVSTLELIDGGILKYERKYYCSPNKNEADKARVAEWLRQQGGASLIKERAVVDGSKVDALKEAKIPFAEICDFNTNSLKAFLKDKIGATGGTAQITMEDIPDCIHFQEIGTVEIEV
jgi:hypothetical protein